MNILAIEHSTATGSIALLNGEEIVEEATWQQAPREPSSLIEKISTILTQQKLNASEIDVFVVGQGPGIYSSLRISLSTANGLALPGKKPVYGISSAIAIAQKHAATNHPDKITVIGDARRNRVWYAPFKVTNEEIKDSQPYQLIAIDELSGYLQKDDTIISPDWSRLAEPLANIETNNANIIQCDKIADAATIGLLAYSRVKQNIDPQFPLAPIYIHPPVFIKPKFPQYIS